MRLVSVGCIWLKETFGFSERADPLKNVGHNLGRSTVANVLEDAGIEPSPERRSGDEPPSWLGSRDSERTLESWLDLPSES